jgi:hypothetical protein
MKFFFPFFLLLLCSCEINNTDINSDLEIYRFENSLFNSTKLDFIENKQTWDNELGDFSNSYYRFISGVNNSSDSLIKNQLLSFINNDDMMQVYDTIFYQFNDFSNIKNQLDFAFNKNSLIFTTQPQPKIITMFSGFNYGVIVQDSLIAIGLDFYLGKNSIFYDRLGDAEYLKYQKQKKFMLPNIMEAWYDSFFNSFNKKNNFLSNIIYKGKIMYLLSIVLPEKSLEDRLRFSKKELSWCVENESLIWKYFIENNLLFSNREKDYRSYLKYGPFSKGMTKDSPSRISYFIGAQIIDRYMSRNSDVSINDLMLQTDHMTILNNSKYKP